MEDYIKRLGQIGVKKELITPNDPFISVIKEENNNIDSDIDDLAIRKIFREELKNLLPKILEDFYKDKMVLERTGQKDEILFKVGETLFKGKMELLK